MVLAPHPDDASSDEFLNRSLDLRVPHVLVECCGIGLGLLEDTLHDGILQDLKNLDIHVSDLDVPATEVVINSPQDPSVSVPLSAPPSRPPWRKIGPEAPSDSAVQSP
jgi:hypothetical protein